MPFRNERAYEVINKDYFPKDFKISFRCTGMMVTPDSMFFPVMRIKRSMLKIALLKINFPCR